jgi:hypothetical protein
VARPASAGPEPSPRTIHYHSHADLLRDLEPGANRPLDGIVVPTTRPTALSHPALVLGRQLGVPVVVLGGGPTAPNGGSMIGAIGPGHVIVNLPANIATALPDLETFHFFDGTDRPPSDLYLKRDIGLVIGRLAGWRTLLFLDDDIDGIGADDVQHAVAALDPAVAVGLPVMDEPDNSLVCHANRRWGNANQDVFVGGAALAVDLELASGSFFADIYNEDWLFLAPFLSSRTVLRANSVLQRPDASLFGNPDRARLQEFGDIVAEGLVGYLHHASLGSHPTEEYWTDFLRARAELIASVAERCADVAGDDPHAVDAGMALEQAEKARAAIRPGELTQFLECWRRDRAIWRRFALDLPTLGSPAATLDYLSERSTPTPYIIRSSQDPELAPGNSSRTFPSSSSE